MDIWTPKDLVESKGVVDVSTITLYPQEVLEAFVGLSASGDLNGRLQVTRDGQPWIELELGTMPYPNLHGYDDPAIEDANIRAQEVRARIVDHGFPDDEL